MTEGVPNRGNSLDIFVNESASPALQQAFLSATEAAEAAGRPVTLAHVILTLLDDPAIHARLDRDTETRARSGLARLIYELPPGKPGALGFNVEALIDPAREFAAAAGAPDVSPLIFLATCLSRDVEMDAPSAKVTEIARASGITPETLSAGQPPRDLRRLDYSYKSLGFGKDLTAMARAGVWDSSPLIGMEEELETLATFLGTGSVCVIGEPGIGKSALIEGFAWRLAKKDPWFPDRMHGWTIVSIQAEEIVAGTGIQGQLEERLKDMVSFFIRNPTVIPFFDEVHRLLDTEDKETRRFANIIKDPMARGLFKCVACTTDKEFARYISPDQALVSRLNRLLLPEPDEATARKIITGARTGILQRADPALQLGIEISDEAIETAVDITSTHQRTARLPRKAIDLLERTVTEKVREIEKNRGVDVVRSVGRGDVARVFSKLTGLPVDALDPNRSAYYEGLRVNLAVRVKGQGNAIDDVVSHLALHARGWVRPGRPRGRFLFLGPPGVGKTELAAAVADEEVMRDKGSRVVVNMAEYSGQTALAKFMGADPSYVGFGQTATLYTRVSMRPLSVVVLDEFEKSHPDLANPMISILDGSADDSRGEHVDFSQCVFFLTSNAMARRGERLETHYWQRMNEIDEVQDLSKRARLRDALDEELRADLCYKGTGKETIWTRPLLDRLDRVCIFRPLAPEALCTILDGLIAALEARSKTGLPDALHSDSARADILADAMSGEEFSSARRLERALLRWLQLR